MNILLVVADWHGQKCTHIRNAVQGRRRTRRESAHSATVSRSKMQQRASGGFFCRTRVILLHGALKMPAEGAEMAYISSLLRRAITVGGHFFIIDN
jgi:hypothetical protein